MENVRSEEDIADLVSLYDYNNDKILAKHHGNKDAEAASFFKGEDKCNATGRLDCNMDQDEMKV